MPAERRLIRLVGSLPRKLKITASSEQNTAARVRGTKVLSGNEGPTRSTPHPVGCENLLYTWACSEERTSIPWDEHEVAGTKQPLQVTGADRDRMATGDVTTDTVVQLGRESASP